jgi:hypothetical protein
MPSVAGAQSTAAPQMGCSIDSARQAKVDNPSFTLTLTPEESKVNKVVIRIALRNLTDRDLYDGGFYERGVDTVFYYCITDEDGNEVQKKKFPTEDGHPLLYGEFLPGDISPHSTKGYDVPLSYMYPFNLPGRYTIQVCRYDGPAMKDGKKKASLICSNKITIYLSE